VQYNVAIPDVFVERAGQQTQITPAVTSETELLAVYIESIDDNCVQWNGEVTRPFDRLTMDLGTAVQVGDLVRVHGASAQIVAAAPCPTAGPPAWLYCQDPIQEYWACEGGPNPPDPDPDPDPHPDDGYFGGGCNAGGGLGLAAAALLVGVRRRRATRP
jgi:hypothetical protein